ncbi:MAG TPA: PilW family protein [Steroidobacteraceae bacterium]|jgi:type IV pilus assembly protein PilW|nr:PilW family protein [Steroidobacteraceae bacterium]
MSIATTPRVSRAAKPMRLRMRGLSLIELMIAMTISLIVLAAVGWVYQGTVQTYRNHDALSRMQEGARYAFELISKDLRMAGTTGCPFQTSANVLNGAEDDWYKNLFGQPIVNLDKNGTADTVTELSDALSILRADISNEYIVSSHDSAGAVFTLTKEHDIPQGALLVATDCNNAAVFQASAVSATTVTHAAGAGTPGNSTVNLGNGGGAITYPAGSRLYRLNAVTYYVGKNAAGEPSLFRLTPKGADATPTPEELVEGVEDLQVTFGVDTSTPRDGIVDMAVAGAPYVTASWIDDPAQAAALGATAKERWDRVVSVRVSMLMRTVEDRVIPVKQKYSFNGTNGIDPGDRRLRKVFTHVIQVRNR